MEAALSEGCHTQPINTYSSFIYFSIIPIQPQYNPNIINHNISPIYAQYKHNIDMLRSGAAALW